MNSAFLVIAILSVIAGLGFLLINRRLASDQKKDNWKKYFYYLLIIGVVLSSVIIDRKIFAALIILINSIGLIEMMTLSSKGDHPNSRKLFMFVSLGVFALIFLSFSAFILLPTIIIVYTYTIVLVFDGACQVTGQLFGRNKIVPSISPNKTWEGLIYGSFIAILTAVILRDLGSFPLPKSILFGLMICLSSFAGDLLASSFKREFGAKNFSNILPGQGGMFDRFDSFMASGALIGILGIPYLIANSYDKDVSLYLTMTVIFLAVLILGEFLHLFLKIRPEFARITSHVLAGLFSLLLLNRFSSPYFVLVLCIQSALFLYATDKMGFLKSHHSVKRKTYGSAVFFAGVLIAYITSELTSNRALFILPIMILTISDPTAALTGLNTKSRKWKNLISGDISAKSYAGSFAFFVSAFIILFFGLPFFYNLGLPARLIISLLIGLIASFVEAISSKGFDNVAIPVSIILLLLPGQYYF